MSLSRYSPASKDCWQVQGQQCIQGKMTISFSLQLFKKHKTQYINGYASNLLLLLLLFLKYQGNRWIGGLKHIRSIRYSAMQPEHGEKIFLLGKLPYRQKSLVWDLVIKYLIRGSRLVNILVCHLPKMFYFKQCWNWSPWNNVLLWNSTRKKKPK